MAALTAGPLLTQPVPDRPLIVTGTLVDERGVPVAGLDAVLRPYPSNYALDLDLLGRPDALPEAADGVRTGPDGTFSLSAPAIGPYRLEVRPGPLATERALRIPLVHRDILPLRVPLHLEPIELPDHHPLTIKALDPDGRAIEGAFVFVYPTAQQPEGPPYRQTHEQPERLLVELDGASTRTDADGLARFLMPTKEGRVTVSASGFALRTATATGGRAAFRLRPAPDLALRVRNLDGRPAHRAAIRTVGPRPVPLGLTNEQGEAVIVIAADGRAMFEVETASGAFARAGARNHTSRGDTSRSSIVEIQLQRPAAIPGRIADAETGFAVPEAVVWVRSDPGRSTVADGAGVFELAAPIRSGGLDIGVVAGGYTSATAKVTAELLQASQGVSIGLAAAAPLAGWVVDSFEHPVAGANIHIEPSGKGRFFGTRWGRSARATSGPDGSFYIDNALYASAYRLTVDAPAFASVQHELPPLQRNSPAAPIRIVLTKGRQPWGTVVDVERAPVAGAQVRLLWPPDNPEVGNSYGSQEAAQPANSNNRGEFEFPLVAPGPYDLHILHPEYLDLQAETVGVPHGGGYFDLGVFTLTPGSEIRGVVVGPNDNPVSGAEVSMRQRTQGLSWQERAATTDEEGRFRLGGLAPAPTDIIAIADGYAPTVVESVRPATGEPIMIEMAKGASVAGWVLEPDGTGAAGIEVTLTLPAREVPRVARRLLGQDLFRHGRTDGDGRFRFDNVVPAKWTAEARNETSVATQEGIQLTHGDLREIELRLNAPDRLTVFVTNHLAEPVTNADIRASPKDRSRKPVFGDTDAGGRAILWVSPGPLTVVVEHPELLSRSREVVIEPGANELNLQLDTGWEISGTVRSGDGAPIPGVAVEASKQLAGEDGDNEVPVVLRRFRRILEPPARALSDIAGGFRLAGLERGRYRLVARLAGFTEGELPNTIEINGQSIADVTLVLKPGASVQGFVTGLDSVALASAEVQAWQGVLFRRAKPGSDGSFELRALGVGTWQMAATTGERQSPTQEVPLEPGEQRALVELRFEMGFRLSGQVSVTGQPARGGFVSALLSGGQHPRRTRTDHQGRFEMEGLEAGPYDLEFRHVLGFKQVRQIDLQGDYHNVLVNLQPRQEPPN